MSKNGQRFLTSAALVVFGLLAGVMVAQIGSAVAGTGQQAQRAANTDAPPALQEAIPQGAFVRVAEQTQQALVYIQTEQTVSRSALLGDVPEFFRRFLEEDEDAPDIPDQLQASQGSGFLISASGYIVTNAHVVSQADVNAVEVINAENITVRLNNDDEYDAQVVGVDIGTDLAVLKIDAGNDLPFIPLGDSDQSRVGEWVMALGAPFGLTNTVSAGIISAVGRAQVGGLGGAAYRDFIQTDASINPGNSGGPLVNLRGEVIGINTAIISNGMQGQFSGVGFAIPINLVSGVVDQLIEHGRTIRGWLGVSMQALSPDMADAYGLNRRQVRGAVLIAAVNEGEPADVAGVREGDIVVGTDGRRLEDDQDFLQRIARTPPDETITLDILRVLPDDTAVGFTTTEESIPVTLGERPPEIQVLADQNRLTGPGNREPVSPGERDLSGVEEKLGVSLAPLTESAAGQLDYDIAEGGVLVTRAAQTGAAARAGLGPGTIIQEVNQRRVNTVEEFTRLIEQVEPGGSVVLRVRLPQGTTARVPLQIPE